MSKDTTKEFYCYEYPRPAVTVDVIIATHERKPRVLLIRRRHDPFAGTWAIPGGFVDMDESLEEAATRELREETGVVTKELEQLYTFGEPGRDPRGRTISVVSLARIEAPPPELQAADDAAELAWHRLDELPDLAFDHAEILADVKERLRKRR